MKVIKKLVIAIISAAFMLSSAATVLADETAATSATPTVDITKLSFDTVYGNQLPDFLNHQYEFNGQKIPLVESNYYFIITFVQLCQYAAYGYFPTTADGYVDLAASFGNNGETYATYFVQQSELYLQRIYIYKTRAIEAGLKIGDEEKQAVEKEIRQRTEQQAKPAGVSLDTILKLYFGPDCDEAAYRTILENAALASKYQQKYLADYQVPEDQKNIPSITYALFSAPASSASEDDKKNAEASANQMLKNCKSIDDLKTAGASAKSSGVCKDAGTLPVQKGKMVPAFEEWAYGAERKVGEMAVIYSKEYGYFCVGYNGLVELDANEKKDMASKALNTEITNEMNAGKYGFKTDKPYPAAKAFESVANRDAVTTTKDKGNSNVLVIVFACIGGAAIVAIVVILVLNTVKANKSKKKPVRSGSKGTIKSGSSKSSNSKSGGSSKGSSSGNKNGSSGSSGSKKTGNKKKH